MTLPSSTHPRQKLSLDMWVRERLDNCHRIAAMRVGKDRDGWLEDAAYFSAILQFLAQRALGDGS